MDHVGTLRWYNKPKTRKEIIKWEKILNRGGGFKFTMSTRVCSNHFAAGYRSDHCRLPTLYLKGDNKTRNKKRKSPSKRKALDHFTSPTVKRSLNLNRNGSDFIDINTIYTPQHGDHIYEVETKSCNMLTKCAQCMQFSLCQHCTKLITVINDLKKKLYEKDIELQNTKIKLLELQKKE